MTTLDQLITALPAHARPSQSAPPIDILGVTDDSREVKPGWLFVAYKGLSTDGHRFIADAIARGAVAVIAEALPTASPTQPSGTVTFVVPNGREAFAWLCAAWQGFPSRDLTMIGVTGTDGKTTTTNLIFNILESAGLRAGMISTVNAVIGERALDTGLHTTTPDADEVQAYLAQMRAAGLTHCVLEVTSHALAQFRVDGVAFDVAVVTNITHEHLDVHGSREAYRAAKARLFEMTAARRGKTRWLPTAVLNADDAFSFEHLRAIPVARSLSYSAAEPTLAEQSAPTVRATDVAHAPDSLRFTAKTPRGDIAIASSLIGQYNVSNILAAVCVGLALDVPTDAIRRGVAALKGVPGRMERIDEGQTFTAIVDFAHTPNALEQCLRALRPITRGRVICAFGCAGERDHAKRAMMGGVAARLADIAIFTAEDPRRESLDDILAEMQAGADAVPAQLRRAEIHHVPDRAKAIQFACSLARAGDTVVACGKGHEQSMCFGTTEFAWDDRAAMRTALRETLSA